MSQAHFIETPKTARIFTHGTLTGKTKLVWIVAHGYGFQLFKFSDKIFCQKTIAVRHNPN